MKLCVRLFILICCLAFDYIALADPSIPEYNKEEVMDRLKEIESIIKPRYTTPVEGYLKGYVIRNRAKSEKVLGRTVMYFPLFEKYLKEYGLPEDLKYLSIVESALQPKALSRVGAGGLWQFMPETGKSYGLKIDRYIDERSCPNKATEAAMKHLSRLYKRYNDWELALAAYNSGSGRVNRAIKLARSRNFWRIQKYLPRETRNYVPAFIAATYLYKFHHLHNLEPLVPDMDLQMTETTKVYDYLSFQKIVEVTGVPRKIIEELNPSYNRGFIPRNPNGNFLTLPKRVMTAVYDYFRINNPDSKHIEPLDVSPIYVKVSSRNKSTSRYFRSIYTVAEGDEIDELAKLFDCTFHHLKLWNGLHSEDIYKGQELTIYYPTKLKRYRPAGQDIESLPTPSLETMDDIADKAKKEREGALEVPKADFIYYQLRRYESLLDVSSQFKNVSIQEIIEWNGFTRKNWPAPGDKIKIKQK